MKKRVERKMKRMNVILDEATVKKLKQIALKNISMGIRIAVRDYKPRHGVSDVQYDDRKNVNVTLDEATIQNLKTIGHGNVSMAIRIVAKYHKIKK